MLTSLQCARFCTRAGLLGERSARLLATLLVIHTLTVATSAVLLSVDAPRFTAGGVSIVDSAKYPLLAIVNCSGGQLEVSGDVHAVFGSGSFEVQFEENSNMPSQFFILPNDTGIAVLTGGEYSLVINCRNQSMVETMQIEVSVLPPGMAAGVSLPYFTDTPRYVNISASTPPGAVIAIYKAEVSATHTVCVMTGLWVAISKCMQTADALPRDLPISWFRCVCIVQVLVVGA